jgi:uncharacterized membrane protein YkoI
MRFRSLLLSLAALAVTIPVAQAQRFERDRDRGGPPGSQSWNPGGQREAGVRPFREILRSVEQQLPGRIVGAAQLGQLGGRAVYFLRWQTADGRLLDLAVDADSGAILR